MKVFQLFSIMNIIETFISVSYDDINELKDRLLKDYDKNTVPVLNQRRPIHVKIDILLKSIISFEEKAGILRTLPIFVPTWNDEKLKWNSTDVNIDVIPFPSESIWHPIIYLLNTVSEDWTLATGTKIKGNTLIYANGSAQMPVAGLTDTKCDANIFYYPFDRHICSFDLMAGLSKQYMILQIHGYESALPPDTNKEWEIESIKRESSTVFGSVNVSLAIFSCTFKRKPTFLILNILSPIVGLGLLNPIVFALPESSGERVSLSVTILLTLVFYLNMIADRLPPINDPISMLNISVMIQAGNSVIILICVVVTMILYDKHTNNAPVPRFLQNMLVHYQCLKKKVDANSENRIHINRPSNQQNSEIQNTNAEKPDSCCLEREETNIEDIASWKDVGKLVNQTFLRLFTLLTFMNWLSYLLVIMLGINT